MVDTRYSSKNTIAQKGVMTRSQKRKVYGESILQKLVDYYNVHGRVPAHCDDEYESTLAGFLDEFRKISPFCFSPDYKALLYDVYPWLESDGDSSDTPTSPLTDSSAEEEEQEEEQHHDCCKGKDMTVVLKYDEHADNKSGALLALVVYVWFVVLLYSLAFYFRDMAATIENAEKLRRGSL